jgi:hypothetical protein
MFPLSSFNFRQHYTWLHDSVQRATFDTISVIGKGLLYSKIGKAFLLAIRPNVLVDLLYNVLRILNEGMDAENNAQRQLIADMNLFVLVNPN